MKFGCKRVLSALISISLLVFILYLCDLQSIAEHLSSTDLTYLPLFIIVLSATTLLRILKWKILLRRVRDVPLGKFIPIQMAGFLLRDVSPARMAEVAKVYFLKKMASVPMSKSMRSAVIDRLNDMVVLVSLSLILLYSLASNSGGDLVKAGVPAAALFLLLCALLSFLLKSRRVAELLKKFLDKVPYVGGHVNEQVINSFYDSHVGALEESVSLLLTFAAVMLDGVLLYLIYLSLGYSAIPFHHYALVFSLSIVVGFVSFLPGGLGSLEAVFIGLLVLNGVDRSLAATGILIWRSFSLAYMLVGGLISMYYMRRWLL